MHGRGGAIEKLALEIKLALVHLLDQVRLVLRRSHEVARHSSRGRRKRTPNLPDRLLPSLQDVSWIVACLLPALASHLPAAPRLLLYSLGHDQKPTGWRSLLRRSIGLIETGNPAASAVGSYAGPHMLRAELR